ALFARLLAHSLDRDGDHGALRRRQLPCGVLPGLARRPAMEATATGADGDSLLDELSDSHLRVDAVAAQRRRHQLIAAAHGADSRAAETALQRFRGAGRAGLRRVAVYDSADLRGARTTGHATARSRARPRRESLLDVRE